MGTRLKKVKELTDLISKYKISDEVSNRVQLQQEVKIIFSKPILDLSKSFAEDAIRYKNKSLIFDGLIAHCLENVRVDSRYNLMGLSLILHSANILNISDEEINIFLNRYTLEPLKKLALEFLNRNLVERAIEKMGFIVSENKHFTYQSLYPNDII